MWLNDGRPEHVGVFLNKVSVMEGGYVVVLQLDNREHRIAATNDPARFLTAWKSKSRSTGGVDVSSIWVSQTHIRYERIKRLLEARTTAQDTIETIAAKLAEIFTLASKPADHTLKAAE